MNLYWVFTKTNRKSRMSDPDDPMPKVFSGSAEACAVTEVDAC